MLFAHTDAATDFVIYKGLILNEEVLLITTLDKNRYIKNITTGKIKENYIEIIGEVSLL